MNENIKYIYEALIVAWTSYKEATGRKDFNEFMEFLEVGISSHPPSKKE